MVTRTNPASSDWFERIELINSRSLSVQINASGLDAADGIITLLDSNDNEQYFAILDESNVAISQTLGSGNNNYMIRVNCFTADWIEIRFASVSNTSGTIISTVNGKQ